MVALSSLASTQEKYFSIFRVFLQTRAFDTKTSQTKISFKMSLRDLSVKHCLSLAYTEMSRDLIRKYKAKLLFG